MRTGTKTKVRLAMGLLTALIMAAPTVALAANVPANRSVVNITHYWRFAVIEYSPDFTNNIGCASSRSSSHAVISWAGRPDMKALLATVLLAQSLGNKIGLGISGCFAWDGGVPSIYRIDAPQ